MSDFHAKKIDPAERQGRRDRVLPRRRPADHVDARHGCDADAPGLERCPSCDGDLVYPVDWREAEDDRGSSSCAARTASWFDRSAPHP